MSTVCSVLIFWLKVFPPRSDMFDEKSESERLIDPITKWKLMYSQLSTEKNSKLKWKIAATKARMLKFKNNEQQQDLSSFSFYFHFLNTAMDQAGSAEELFNKEKSLEKLYYMMMMTVDPNYRGKGIASKLITCCFEVKTSESRLYQIMRTQVGKLNNCDSAFVVATNPITAKIFRKHHMTNLR